jgi:hypothetical protein
MVDNRYRSILSCVGCRVKFVDNFGVGCRFILSLSRVQCPVSSSEAANLKHSVKSSQLEELLHIIILPLNKKNPTYFLAAKICTSHPLQNNKDYSAGARKKSSIVVF